RLTDEGRDWIASVRDHYDGLEEALRRTALRNRNGEQLHIGLSAPFGRTFLVHLIDRFARRYPQIEVTLQDGSCRKQANAIRRRHLDIAFMCGGCQMRSCQSETIWEEGMAALLPAGHPLAGKDALTWTDFAGERLLVPQGTDGPLLDPCLTHGSRQTIARRGSNSAVPARRRSSSRCRSVRGLPSPARVSPAVSILKG